VIAYLIKALTVIGAVLGLACPEQATPAKPSFKPASDYSVALYVSGNFICGQAMPDNFALTWMQATNLNILLVQAILLRGVPVRGFEAKVYRCRQHRSCPLSKPHQQLDCGAQLGVPTIRRNVYIPQTENVGADWSSQGLLLVNLLIFSNLIDREQVFDTLQTLVGCSRSCSADC
jgi:hypothetical protein